MVQAVIVFAYSILAEAGLSFLGAGTPPPQPSWGNMISEGKMYTVKAPWLLFAPGFAIAVTVLSLNLLGDTLRDVLDPKLRRRGIQTRN